MVVLDGIGFDVRRFEGGNCVNVCVSIWCVVFLWVIQLALKGSVCGQEMHEQDKHVSVNVLHLPRHRCGYPFLMNFLVRKPLEVYKPFYVLTMVFSTVAYYEET